MSDAASASPSMGCVEKNGSLRALLKAYLDTLEHAGEGPSVFRSPAGRVPVVRRLLLYSVVQHLSRSSAALKRRYSARAAVSADAAKLRQELASLDDFEHSLAQVPYRRLALLGLVSVFLVAFVLARFVFRSSGEAVAFGRLAEGVLKLDRGELVDAAHSFTPASYLGTVFIVAAAVWLVLAPSAAAARHMRLLFRPRAGSSVSVYDLERTAFAAVAARPPRERRLDLVSAATFLVLPLWLAVIFFTFATVVVFTGVERISGVWAAIPFYLAGVTTLGWVVTKGVGLVRAARTPDLLKVPPFGRWSIVAQTGAAAAIAVAFVIVLAPSLVGSQPSPPLILNVRSLQLVGFDISRGHFLSRTRQSAPRLSVAQLQQRGLALDFTVAMSGSLRKRFRSRYSISCIYHGCSLSGRRIATATAFGPELTGTRTPGPSAVDRRSLLLLNFADLRRSVERARGVASLRARVHMWIPLRLDARGVARVEISIVDDRGTPLQAVTARVTQHEAFFATSGQGPVELIPPTLP
jgi:hypothetical protein